MLTSEYHKKLFSQRRQNLLQLIKDPHPFLIILFNSPVYPVGSDAHYRYRPDSSFFYLTGLTEEESACLIWKNGQKVAYKLFVRPRDALREQWDGYRLGPEGAQKTLDADSAHEIKDLSKHVNEWMKTLPRGSTPRFYSNFSTHEINQKKLILNVREASQGIPFKLADISNFIEALPYIRKLRLLKDEHEISLLKKASEINNKAHLELMQKLKPGMTEYQAQAILEFVYLNEGAAGPGYTSILGSAENATILHYHENSRKMSDSELLLADAGCEYKLYQSDITRTLPVGKSYTPLQRKLMDIVHEAKAAGISVCKVGNKLSDVHKTASLCLIEGLKHLKLLKGPSEKIFEKGLHKKYYPHGTGHWLGLDVHDPSASHEEGKDVLFEAGMLLTVEPGLYFLKNDKSVPKEFRGLGVRLEDDILIQPKGKAPLNLNADLPSRWQDIESVKKSAK